MLSDALASLIQIFSAPFRAVMWKSLSLTASVLFLLGLGLDRLASSLRPATPTWLSWILSIVVTRGIIASLILLAVPTASLVASSYLGNIADAVEREIDPLGPRGRPLPLPASLSAGLRFAVLSLLVNLAVLALTLFMDAGFVAFFVLNGYRKEGRVRNRVESRGSLSAVHDGVDPCGGSISLAHNQIERRRGVFP